jgi:CubicO group peptidase (beta-lactamase class C family)
MPATKHRFHAIAFRAGACFALASIGLLCAGARAQGEAAADFRAIDAYVSAKMRAPRIPGVALAIVKGDRIAYLKGYGRADSSGRPVTPQTAFLLGSVTKSITALAAMQLVEAGRIELDAPVRQYIPWFRTADAEASAGITVRQLLNQTSGLPMLRDAQFVTDQDDGVLERTVRSLASARMDFPPGSSFEYSNANYDTLGLLVQIVSGTSYETYVRDHIFLPLDMRNSFASWTEAQRHDLAYGHRWWFGIPFPSPLPWKRAELPAGYALASAEDMAHYLIAQMNGGRYGDVSVLSPEGMALMHTEPARHTYAMGWERLERDGRTLINHDGGTADFQTSVFFDPDARIGVFVAANIMSSLDAFSSPHGNSPLDGATTRAMAASILNFVAHRPLPDQGPGIRRHYVMFDLLLLLASAAVIVSLARMPARHRRLARTGIRDRADYVRRAAVVTALHFVWPACLLYAIVGTLNWKVLAEFQPDLTAWLEVAAVVIALKGVAEIVLLRRVFVNGSHESPRTG